MSLHVLSKELPQSGRGKYSTGGLPPRELVKAGPVAKYLCRLLGDTYQGLEASALGGSVITFPAGRTISRAGETASTAVLLSGWASQQRISSKGNRQIFSFFTPGEFLGLGALVNGAACADVVAITPVTAIFVKSVGSVTGEGLAMKLTLALKLGQARATARLYDSIVLLGHCTAYERLAYLLVDTFERLAEVGLATKEGIHFPLTQEIIGNALGITSVHVNRTLHQLRQQHLCEISAGRLIIPDKDRIQNVIHGIRRSMEYSRPGVDTAQSHSIYTLR